MGSSRGQQPTGRIVGFLIEHRVDILFCIGGDGTLRGAQAIAKEVQKRNLNIAIVGIPKTIDNDVMYVSRTFGLVTATEKAREILDCAHSEARSAYNGIGLVKLMGRDAGFIAASATVASIPVISSAALAGRLPDGRQHSREKPWSAASLARPMVSGAI